MSALLDELRAAVARYQREDAEVKEDPNDRLRIAKRRIAIDAVSTAFRNYAVEGKLTREGFSLVADLGDGTEAVLTHHALKPSRRFRAPAKAWLISRGVSTGLDRLAEETLRAAAAGDEMPDHMFGSWKTRVEIRKTAPSLQIHH